MTTSLAVSLGHELALELTPDARTLAEAYLAHALNAVAEPTAPNSRTMRTRYLRGWSRRRYAAAVNSLTEQHHHTVTTHAGVRRLHVTVPAVEPPRLLAGSPRIITRDLVRLRIWTEPDGTPDWRTFLGDLDALGSFVPGQVFVVDLGETTWPHPWIVASLRGAIAAGQVPRPQLESRRAAVTDAWRRAIHQD